MKIKVWAEFDTSTRQYTGWSAEGEGITLEHSGSSYYRIIKDNRQLGTIGGHCPGTERERSFMVGCEHTHLSISFDLKAESN